MREDLAGGVRAIWGGPINPRKKTPPVLNVCEMSTRYQYGLNIDLPGEWHGQIYDSRSYDTNRYYYNGGGPANVSAVSAALGWTILPTAASGTLPAIATWTRPATVPYLNLFCDARTIQCNSPTTLNYVTGLRSFSSNYWVNEKGITFDGPLFALPAGEVKAAIGANYVSHSFLFKV